MVEKKVNRRERGERREEVSRCGVKSKEIVKNFYFFRNLVVDTCAFGRPAFALRATAWQAISPRRHEDTKKFWPQVSPAATMRRWHGGQISRENQDILPRMNTCRDGRWHGGRINTAFSPQRPLRTQSFLATELTGDTELERVLSSVRPC